MRTLYTKVLETSVNGLIEFKVMAGEEEEMPTTGVGTGSWFLIISTGIVCVYSEENGWTPEYTIQSLSESSSDSLGVSISPLPISLDDRIDKPNIEIENEPAVEEEEVVTTKKRGK